MPTGHYDRSTKVVWDDAADKRFLLAIIKTAGMPKMEDVATTLDNGVNASSLT